ncbi:DUF6320 domain-containing protein [Brachybacterium sp. DNPG3]
MRLRWPRRGRTQRGPVRRPWIRRRWVRLDNASTMLLAARSDADPKVFRLGAELDHDVDPVLLQAALEATFARFPLYRAVLRRGVFWYYLQDSDLVPQVAPESEAPCAPIYQADRRTLLFRVVHHRRRISLEVFHALSDGTGALWFLDDLVAQYLRLRRSGDCDAAAPPTHELAADSFAHYFRRRRRAGRGAVPADFAQEIAAGETLAAGQPPGGPVGRLGAASGGASAPTSTSTPTSARREPAIARRRAHRVRGTRTPDGRMRAVELTMPVDQVLALARSEGTAMTMYLTAVFFEAIRRTAAPATAGRAGRAGEEGLRLTASVPVNLRQYFPSTSARNFFATTRVEHVYPAAGEPESVGEVARSLERAFRAEADPAALEERVRGFLRFERHPLLRVVPRPMKDVLLRAINGLSNRGLSVAVSNLGRTALPEDVDAQVRRLVFSVSAVRPQFCAISHGGLLTVTFTSPFVETDHVREFARVLTSAGVDVSLAAGRVTEEELCGTGTGTGSDADADVGSDSGSGRDPGADPGAESGQGGGGMSGTADVGATAEETPGLPSCADCGVRIEGDWRTCPLCGAAITVPAVVPAADAADPAAEPAPAAASPFPAVPLRYSRRRLVRTLMLVSVGMVLVSFAVQLLLGPEPVGLGVGRTVWLAIMSLWLVVLAAVRKRRNIAKSTLYLVVLVGLVATAWDYLLGWTGWSVDFAIPILCSSSLIALIVLVRAMRIEVGEHIVYSGLIVLLGLVPLGFLALGWVAVPLPSVVCGALCLVALSAQRLSLGGVVRHELAKRLHL